MELRTILLIIVITLSVIDLSLTYYYVNTYKEWQPQKPYKMMERNPVLVFLWNTFGLHLGMFIGIAVIFALNYVIAKHAHWGIVLILILILSFTIINHAKNFGLLFKLIERYPAGHLPETIFGKVVGNN